MSEMNSLKDFELPESEVKTSPPSPKRSPLHQKCLDFCEKRFGKNSKVTTFIAKLESTGSGDSVVDAFSIIKKNRSAQDRLNASLTMGLIVILLLVWRWGLPMLREADQLRNDIQEQAQVIEIEEKNNMFLDKLANDKELLTKNIHTVYAAIPDADEKAEEVIAMLEDIGAMNRMVIDAIGIRKLPESQNYYDDLVGVVDIYEYTFTLESSLPNILSFISSLRQSLRLMDIMAMEIEENKGLYRASFVLHSYHLTNY